MPADLTQRILAALGHLVLQYDGAGSFAVKGVTPDWTARFPRIVNSTSVHVMVLMETFNFLETALMNLDRVWLDTRDTIKELGEWVEVDSDGAELHLKAMLLSVEGTRLMIVSVVDERTIDLIRRARGMLSKR